MDELEYTDCPLCKSKNYDMLFHGKDFLFSQIEFSVVRCSSCGLLFTNPRVREDKIPHYYFPDYSPYKEMHQSGVINKVKDMFRPYWGNINWEILKVLRSFNVRTVLEIGPGNGSLLFFLKEHGYGVTGVEIDSSCVERIRERGIPCYLGDLTEKMKEIGPKRFDAVVMCQVFEHLYHPKETLKNIYNLLNEQGVIYLDLPNCASLEAKLFGKYWCGYDLPRHIIHYNVKTISAILTETDFYIHELKNMSFPSFLIVSLAFRFFKKGKMPDKLYYLLYYLWKLLVPIHIKIIGSGIMKVVAGKMRRDKSY